MLESLYNSLFDFLYSTFGQIPITEQWIALASLIGSVFVFIVPFYIVFRVVEWLIT